MTDEELNLTAGLVRMALEGLPDDTIVYLEHAPNPGRSDLSPVSHTMESYQGIDREIITGWAVSLIGNPPPDRG